MGRIEEIKARLEPILKTKYWAARTSSLDDQAHHFCFHAPDDLVYVLRENARLRALIEQDASRIIETAKEMLILQYEPKEAE